jgi:hypothetical protein
MAKDLKKNLKTLIDSTKALGLNQKDIDHSLEYLAYNEYGLCFDQIVTQLYEYDIEITLSVYQLIEEIGMLLDLSPSDYSHMKETIKDKRI